MEFEPAERERFVQDADARGIDSRVEREKRYSKSLVVGRWGERGDGWMRSRDDELELAAERAGGGRDARQIRTGGTIGGVGTAEERALVKAN